MQVGLSLLISSNFKGKQNKTKNLKKIIIFEDTARYKLRHKISSSKWGTKNKHVSSNNNYNELK